ncbi:tyrosine-type recombinase/integrase [Agrilactobacillus fermenti]|uniref:tyrosine-type recombinase/integrase n=1 Tax=Agrilactobacillus fermenti TaxID=2586909 RepID=UPI003A5B9EA5
MKKLKQEQLEFYVKIGYRDPHDLVFRNNKLSINDNGSTNQALARLCASVNVPRITTHGLRHTHGSILLYHGASIFSVSKRLGHKDIQTTMDTYLHVIDELRQKDDTKMLSALEQIF